MLSCKACVRRNIRNLAADVNSRQIRSFSNSTACRNQKNSTGEREGHEDEDVRELDPRIRFGSAYKSGWNEKEGGSSNFSRQKWLDSRGTRPSGALPKRTQSSAFEPMTNRAMKKNLEYLQDPLKLAITVRKYLRSDQYEHARELVEAASRGQLVTVSWNHIIDWQLSKGKINSAVKTYNEMKKRAQIPDAHTFTILFRGLATASEPGEDGKQPHPNAAAKALSIYNSMLSERAPVKPNTIHMNAVLKVCARAGDVDAMLGIAAQMEDGGLRAPNNLTFTTIINALRTSIQHGTDQETLLTLRRKTIHDLRRIWVDITKRWRKGDIWVDEELVCSMGRALMLGEIRDIDDIFSLVEQTMNIPRAFPPLGTDERDRIDPSRQNKPSTEVEEPHTSNGKILASGTDVAGNVEGVEPVTVSVLEDQFTSIAAPIKKGKHNIVYAKPGQNTLSLLAEACLALKIKSPMAVYWKSLTDDFGITPDSQNYMAYLRVLRIARASSAAAELLSSIPPEQLENRFFRVAIAACQRDNQNPNAFAHASRIVHLMQRHIAEPDIPVLQKYLSLALAGHKTQDIGDADGAKYRNGRQILRALDQLGPAFLNIKSSLSYPSPPPRGASGHHAKSYHARSSQEYYNNAIALSREMISAYDQLMNKGMVPREMYGDLTQRRSKIAAYVRRAMEKNPQATMEKHNRFAHQREKSRRSEMSDGMGDHNDNDIIPKEVSLDGREWTVGGMSRTNYTIPSQDLRGVRRGVDGISLRRTTSSLKTPRTGGMTQDLEEQREVNTHWKAMREDRDKDSKSLHYMGR